MSHGITKADKQQGITMGLHKLTEVLKEILLPSCWLAQWDITKRNLFLKDDAGQEIATEYCQLVATDDKTIQIGAPVHCDTYQPITNAVFLKIIAEAIAEIKGAKIASVGSVCNRGRVFVSVQLDALETFTAAGRQFNPFLNFLNSHDQSAPFGVTTSNICTVCNNTFGMNLSMIAKQRSGLKAAETATAEAKAVRIRLKHTKNVAERLENIPEIIDGFLGAQAVFKDTLNKMAAEPIRVQDADPLFTGFLSGMTREVAVKASKAELELSTRRSNQIDRLSTLFVKGAGNRGENMADAYSAVTDYFTHESSGGDDMNRQFVSSEFGAGQTAKARAFRTFADRDDVSDMIEAGKIILAANR